MKKILFFAILAISSLFLFADSIAYKADITSSEAYAMQQKGVMLIDVRTIQEYSFSRPKGAKNIPIYYDKNGGRVFNENFIEQIDYALKGDMDKPIILICRSGSRTKEAANLLGKKGYTNVYNIEKGFVYDWLKVELPVER